MKIKKYLSTLTGTILALSLAIYLGSVANQTKADDSCLGTNETVSVDSAMPSGGVAAGSFQTLGTIFSLSPESLTVDLISGEPHSSSQSPGTLTLRVTPDTKLMVNGQSLPAEAITLEPGDKVGISATFDPSGGVTALTIEVLDSSSSPISSPIKLGFDTKDNPESLPTDQNVSFSLNGKTWNLSDFDGQVKFKFQQLKHKVKIQLHMHDKDKNKQNNGSKNKGNGN